MKRYDNPKKGTWVELTKRPEIDAEELMPLVKEVFEQVEKQGDSALIKYTRLFDHKEIRDVIVDPKDIAEADQNVSNELKKAIDTAITNIKRFHASQLTGSIVIETTAGVECWRVQRGIEKVGIYVPGGEAPLFSTVLMLAIPAKLAGCKEVILCTPPNENVTVDNAILYAAHKSCRFSKKV
jgi:histidinol dehydrogenase